MKKTIGMILVLVLSLSLVVSATGAFASEAEKVIYVIGKENQYDHWLTLKAGTEQAGADFGYKVVYEAPPLGEADIEKQVSMVETYISTKPAAICLAPNDSDACAGVCAQVREAGIPMILFDTGLPTDDYDYFIAFDNKAAAARLAEVIAQKMGGKGKVAIISAVAGSGTLMARESGYSDYLKENYPDITIVDEILYCQNDSAKAMSQAYDLLAAHPDLGAIFTVNTQSGEGVAAAIEEMGKGGQLLMAGFDPSATIEDFVRRGIYTALNVTKSYAMGYKTVEIAAKTIEGKPVEEAAGKFIDSGSIVVTQENVDSDEAKELLHPFG
ncbi:MAG: ABC transporter substrate-binding protein [Clostridia bacterium]